MRIAIAMFTALLFFSCKQGEKKQTIKQSFEIPPARVDSDQIANTFKYKGAYTDAWHWKDKLGGHLLILSQTAPYEDTTDGSEETSQAADLYIMEYVKKDTGYSLYWQYDDDQKACPFDITAEFIKDAVSVTDLDSNGIAETTILYRMACRSDVSPAVMKLIMHTKGNVYSLKGLGWIRSSDTDSFNVHESDANLGTLAGYKKTDEEYLKTFGRYESENDFKGAPPAFLSYVRKQWMRFVVESTE